MSRVKEEKGRIGRGGTVFLSGNTRAADALNTSSGVQRDLKLELGFCNKKTGVLLIFKKLHFLINFFDPDINH